MSMYKIPPLVPEDVNVKPADILYFLPSYHDAVSQNVSFWCFLKVGII